MKHALPLTLAALLTGLTACKPKESSQAAADTMAQVAQEPTSVQASVPLTRPEIQQTQAQLDQHTGGRACTTFIRTMFRLPESADNVQLKKYRVLAAHGAVTLKDSKDAQGVTYVTASIPENLDPKQGTWVTQGQMRFFCFGRWVVTDAVKDEGRTDKDQTAYRVTYELADAVEWVKMDAASDILAVPTPPYENNDPTAMKSYDFEKNQVAPASFALPNHLIVFVPN